MSPYIITTRRPVERALILHDGRETEPVGRRAVATLDEARDACIDAAPEENIGKPAEVYALALEMANLPQQGGTIGPLRDGTVIEVELAEYTALAEAAGVGPAWSDGRVSRERVVAAYNATQEVAA